MDEVDRFASTGAATVPLHYAVGAVPPLTSLFSPSILLFCPSMRLLNIDLRPRGGFAGGSGSFRCDVVQSPRPIHCTRTARTSSGRR